MYHPQINYYHGRMCVSKWVSACVYTYISMYGWYESMF